MTPSTLPATIKAAGYEVEGWRPRGASEAEVCISVTLNDESPSDDIVPFIADLIKAAMKAQRAKQALEDLEEALRLMEIFKMGGKCTDKIVYFPQILFT